MRRSRHGYAVLAGLAGAGVATLADADVTVAAVVGAGAVATALYWYRHDRPRHSRAAAAALTTVGALAAAGWGVVLGEPGRFAATPLSSALLATATVGTGVAVIAGAGAGYYGVRLTDAVDTPSPSEETMAGERPNPSEETTANERTDHETAPGRSGEAGGRVAEQKRAFYFLNNLLRHHVLNGLNVVDGYAARLATDETDEERAAQVIRDRVATMTTVVDNVRSVADVFAGDPELTPTDLTAVVHRVRERATEQHSGATVTVAADGPTEVWCAGGADAVVWELVDNGIVHNDGDEPRVHVRVTETDDDVWLHVADDGPGVDGPTEALLSPGTTGDQGLGLYLVATLVRYARGEVRVTTGDDPARLPDAAGDDERLSTLLAAGGTCVSLRLVPTTVDQPEPSAADRSVEHAIDRPTGDRDDSDGDGSNPDGDGGERP